MIDPFEWMGIDRIFALTAGFDSAYQSDSLIISLSIPVDFLKEKSWHIEVRMELDLMLYRCCFDWES